MSKNITNEVITLLAPYTVELKDFKQIESTPFRLNAINGVYAPAKAGKTYFVLEQLNSISSNYDVIWLDGDRNSELKDKFSNITHIALDNTTEAFNCLVDSSKDFSETIFIIDSFKDFSFGYDTDTNLGCQTVMNIYQKLLDLGATIVIIFHSTKTYNDKSSDFKIKGNADTIKSKLDFLYKLHRTKDDFVNLTVVCAREEGLQPKDILPYGNAKAIKNRIKEAVTKNPNITLRELTRESGLSAYKDMVRSLEGTFYEVVKIKGSGGGRPKEVVKLI